MKISGATASLMDQAHGAIKNRILRGEVGLGESISRRKVAAELGMSFLPVTLALLRLEYEGYVESRPRAGTRVRVPSREDIRGHYVVREALEVQAARMFVTAATEKDIRDLRKMAVRLDVAPPMLDRLQYLRAHQRFHKRIADVARCAALSNTIEQVLALESTWLCAVEKTPNLVAPRHYHEELVEALAQGDPDRAADGIRQHIGVGLDYIMEGLKRHFVRRTNTFARRQTAP